MKDKTKLDELLSAYLDSDLQDDERALVEKQIEESADIQQTLSDLKLTLSHLRSLDEVDTPQGFTERIMSGIREESELRIGILRRVFHSPTLSMPVLSLIAFLILAISLYVFWNYETSNIYKAEEYNKRGIEFYSTGEFDRAIEEFSMALSMDPEFPKAYNNLGVVYYAKGDTDKAIEYYNKTIELDTDYPGAYYNRALAYKKLGKYKMAIEDYNRAISYGATNIKTYYYSRSISFKILGEYKKALHDINSALLIDPTYEKAQKAKRNLLMLING